MLTDGLSAKLLRIFIYALLTQGGDSVAETISEGKDVLPSLIREGALIYDDKREGKPEGAELDGAANVTNGNGDNNDVPRDGDSSPSAPTDGDVGLLSDKGAEPVAEAVEEKKAEAQTLTFEVTAYTAGAESTGKSPGDPAYGITASGEKVREGYTLACPPSLEFGTVVTIEGVGERVCTDRGSDITEGRLDVYMTDLEDAISFGRQTLEVRITEN